MKQESYLKDTTHFINFIENTQIPDNAVFLATLDVTLVLSTPTFLTKKELTLFAAITKITMSRNYLSRQTIYGRN